MKISLLKCRTALVPVLAASMLQLTGCIGGTVQNNPPQVQVDPPVSTPKQSEQTPSEFQQAINQAEIVEDDHIRVGFLVPLSGEKAELGQAMLNAAQLALFDISEDRFVLVPKDTQADPVMAQQAYAQAKQEGASLILGPIFADNVSAVASLARQDQVPVIAFSNSRTVSGRGVWTAGFAPEDQIQRVVTFASRNGYANFASAVPDSSYGLLAGASFVQNVADTGGEILQEEIVQSGLTDAAPKFAGLTLYPERVAALDQERQELLRRGDEASKQALLQLEGRKTAGELPYDGLFLPFSARQTPSVLQLLEGYDLSPHQVRLMGTSLWDNASLGQYPMLQGAWYAAPAPEGHAHFSARYRETFDKRPPKLAGIAYDLTALSAVLTSEMPDSNQFLIEQLLDPNGFAGVNGAFRLLENGDVQRSLAVFEMTPNGGRVIDAAPTSFVDRTN